MFQRIGSSEKHDFFFDPEERLYNILPKGDPAPIAGYKSAAYILHMKGYLPSACWPEDFAEERFYNLGKINH